MKTATRFILWILMVFVYVDEVRPRIHPTYAQDLIAMLLIAILPIFVELIYVCSNDKRWQEYRRKENEALRKSVSNFLGNNDRTRGKW
ncbi:MAG TPA: hypothetical protein VJ742_12485 [Nitrososphaera sp.]|nr:hypothetical protein [Nitrososphaera sp.]